MSNPFLKFSILEVVDNQLKADDPPETRMTLEHLVREGYSKDEAKELIGGVVVSEMYYVLKNQQPFDEERFVNALNNLPRLPED